MGGIYRSVTLRGRGDVGIRDLWNVTQLSADLKKADLKSEILVGEPISVARRGSYRESD